MTIDELKLFTTNGYRMIEILNSRLNIDISDKLYVQDEQIGVWITDDAVILDIGVDTTGTYSYYFENLTTGESLLLDDGDVDKLTIDPVIDAFNKIKVTT